MSALPNKSLDEAIARGIATEDDRCDNRDCDWCHPSPYVVTITGLESLTDPEIQDMLRRARIGRDLRQRDQEIVALDALVIKWRERAQFLEAAVKQYAGHIWNDIEQRLSGVPHE